MIDGLDILVAVKLQLSEGKRLSYQALGDSLGVSASQVHRSVKDLIEVGVLRSDQSVVASKLLMVLFAVPFYMQSKLGAVAFGMPTAFSAPPLDQIMVTEEMPVVWGSADGKVRGHSLSPICKAAPEAAAKDPELYRCLCLVDALRIGNRREVRIARGELRKAIRPRKLEAA